MGTSMEALPKIKKKNFYFWNKETDEAIIAFTKMKAGIDRDKFYTEKIHPAFKGLVGVFWSLSSNWYRIYPLHEFVDTTVPELYEHLLIFKDRRKKCSLYTYFYTFLKQMISNKKRLLHGDNDGNKINTDYLEELENFYPTDNNNLDTQIDMPIIIDEVCNSLSADIDSIHFNATVRAEFGKVIIDYLKTTLPDQIDWKQLRAVLKNKFPEMSRQHRMNILAHYIDVLKKDRTISPLLKD